MRADAIVQGVTAPHFTKHNFFIVARDTPLLCCTLHTVGSSTRLARCLLLLQARNVIAETLHCRHHAPAQYGRSSYQSSSSSCSCSCSILIFAPLHPHPHPPPHCNPPAALALLFSSSGIFHEVALPLQFLGQGPATWDTRLEATQSQERRASDEREDRTVNPETRQTTSNRVIIQSIW